MLKFLRFRDYISELLKKRISKKGSLLKDFQERYITNAGEHLKIHFPHRPDDVNELPMKFH